MISSAWFGPSRGKAADLWMRVVAPARGLVLQESNPSDVAPPLMGEMEWAPGAEVEVFEGKGAVDLDSWGRRGTEVL